MIYQNNTYYKIYTLKSFTIFTTCVPGIILKRVVRRAFLKIILNCHQINAPRSSARRKKVYFLYQTRFSRTNIWSFAMLLLLLHNKLLMHARRKIWCAPNLWIHCLGPGCIRSRANSRTIQSPLIVICEKKYPKTYKKWQTLINI